jgi:hypothetical protein
MEECERSIRFVNNVHQFLPKHNETFMSTFYIHKMIPYQIIQFSEEFKVLLSLFYNDVACRSLNDPYKTFELFIYF